MASLSPELWHIVASYLSIGDATQLRLVNRFFADLAAEYIIPDVSFHMHQEDFVRLRGISSSAVLAPHVRSLQYFTTVYKSPAGTFDEFKKYHEEDIWAKKLNRWRTPAIEGVRRADEATLLSEYEKYKHLIEVQDQIKVDMADLACLKDALAKFTSLRHVTMSSGNQFLDRPARETRSPFKTPFELPTDWERPEGVRHCEVLLEALAHNKIKLDSLRAGTLEWVFFDGKTPTELERLFWPTFDAVHVEFEIALDLDDNLRDLNEDTEKCREFMEEGILRDLLSRMKKLELLRVGFLCDLLLDERPAALQDIMSPSHHWPHLQRLELSSIEADRHSLMQLLSLHKDTLRFLCLQEINLGETSWEYLLPEIRKNPYLEDACICGSMVGKAEDVPDIGLPEGWDLSVPGIWENDMRASINVYCQKGGEKYPNELPLTDEVVEKYFDQYVKCHVKKSEAEEWEEQCRVDTELRGEWREAGLIPRRGNEDNQDSEDSDSGRDGYDEDDEDEDDSYDEMEGINEGLDVNDLGYLDEPYDEEENVEDFYAEMRLQGDPWPSDDNEGSGGSDGGDEGDGGVD